MGHKVNPKIFRLGWAQSWSSKWYSRKQVYANNLKFDIKIRKFLQQRLKTAGIARVEIERTAGRALNIIIYSAKPGVIIGRGGAGIDEIKKALQTKLVLKQDNLNLTIKEVTKPQLDAQLTLQDMIGQIEKRIPFRRVLKQTIRQVMEARALGVKVAINGRLNGVEIARSENLGQGRLPLGTLRADIDYARGAAQTTYGVIGIKVWIYRGDIYQPKKTKVTVK